jgi:hypothetical protein
MKQPIESKCKMCYKAEKHSKHIIAGCWALAPSEYTNGCNKVAGYIHWMICEHIRLYIGYWQVLWIYTWKGHKCQWYQCYVGCTGYHRLNNTSKPTWYSKKKKKKKTYILINIAVPDDSNGNTKETEKLNKYKDLEIISCRIWKVKTRIVLINWSIRNN